MSGGGNTGPSPGSFLGKAKPLILARMATAVITVSIPLVLARALSLEDYGTYKQLFLLLQTLYYILPLGMAQALYFFVPRADDRRPYFGQTLIFLTLMGLAAGLLMGSVQEGLAGYFSNPALLEFRWTQALYLMGILGSYTLEVSLTSQGRTRAAAIAYLISDVIRAAVMTVPILTGFGLRGMMAAAAAFALARLAVAWVVALRGSTGPLFDGRLFVNQLVYAVPFGAAMLLAIPQQYAHQYAVSGSVSPELFAIYAVGCFQLPLVDLLYTPTSEVLMVRLGELERHGRLRESVLAFREAASKLALAFFPLAVFLFAAAPEFIGALFGQRFLPAVPLFRVGLLGVVLAILPMDGVLRARNETRHIFLSYLAKAGVTAPLVYFGVTRLGMIGGIGAWAVAELVGKAVLFLRIPRALSSPERRVGALEVIPWMELGRALLAAGAAGAGVVALRALSRDAVDALPEGFAWRVIPLALAGTGFVVGYLAVLRATGLRPLALLPSFRRPQGLG